MVAPLATFSAFLLGALWLFLPQVGGQEINPLVLPLISRSPYFNLWVNTNPPGTRPNGPVGKWPSLWMGQPIAFSGLVRIDNETYAWQGDPTGRINPPVQFFSAREFSTYLTPTSTVFTITAGSIRFNVTYLNPIEPEDPVKQSFPFALIFIDAIVSLDDQTHTVQFEFDTTGDWLTSTAGSYVQMSTTQNNDLIDLQMVLSSPSPMLDIQGVAEDGTLHVAAVQRPWRTSWEVGDVQSMRLDFNQSGFVNNAQRLSVGQTSSAGVAIIFDAETIRPSTATGSPFDPAIVFTLGYLRDPTIRSMQGGTVQVYSPYFWSRYNSMPDALNNFLTSHRQTRDTAAALDARVMTAAAEISREYRELAALAARLLMSALDVTYIKSGDYGSSPPLFRTFMKDIGTSGRVNPVETLYAAFPGYLFLNSTLAGTLLEPLLDIQNTRNPVPYAAPDLGTTYPIATGNPGLQPSLAIEHTSSMLIMVLAHAQKSGDGSLIVKHYNLLKVWADYLVENVMTQSGQVTADGLNVQNSANLALKGIIAIEAMSGINQAVVTNGARIEHTAFYAGKARVMMTLWKARAVQKDHIASNLNDPASWGMIYNLYGAQLIGSNLIDSSILDAHTAFFAPRVRAQRNISRYDLGIPLDVTQPDLIRNDWTMFAAATLTNQTLSNEIYELIRNEMYSTRGRPWPTLFSNANGMQAGTASPAHGAVFAPLALKLKNQTIRAIGRVTLVAEPTSSSSKTPVGVIVGAVFGVLAFIAIAIAGFWFYKRRKNQDVEGKMWFLSSRPTPGIQDVTLPYQYTNLELPNSHSSADLNATVDDAIIEPFSLSLEDKTPIVEPSMRKGGMHLASMPTVTPIPPGAAASAMIPPMNSLSAGSGPVTNQDAIPMTQVVPIVDHQLREEVNALRQEMAAMRHGQPPADEPPPLYGTS